MARQASPLTLAIRELLKQHKGNITASEAAAPLKALGFETVDQVAFNQIKNTWINRQKEESAAKHKVVKTDNKKPKKEVVVTEQEALDFVLKNGGIKAAKVLVNHQIQLIKVAEETIAALV